jgi:hypothetical protein
VLNVSYLVIAILNFTTAMEYLSMIDLVLLLRNYFKFCALGCAGKGYKRITFRLHLDFNRNTANL